MGGDIVEAVKLTRHLRSDASVSLLTLPIFSSDGMFQNLEDEISCNSR